MNQAQVTQLPAANEIDAATTEVAAGGNCTPAQLVDISGSLIQAYENLVDFTSHVIERVAGSN